MILLTSSDGTKISINPLQIDSTSAVSFFNSNCKSIVSYKGNRYLVMETVAEISEIVGMFKPSKNLSHADIVSIAKRYGMTLLEASENKAKVCFGLDRENSITIAFNGETSIEQIIAKANMELTEKYRELNKKIPVPLIPADLGGSCCGNK